MLRETKDIGISFATLESDNSSGAIVAESSRNVCAKLPRDPQDEQIAGQRPGPQSGNRFKYYRAIEPAGKNYRAPRSFFCATGTDGVAAIRLLLVRVSWWFCRFFGVLHARREPNPREDCRERPYALGRFHRRAARFFAEGKASCWIGIYPLPLNHFHLFSP